MSGVRVPREYERGVVFRLGRLLGEPRGPGLFLLIPLVDRMVRVAGSNNSSAILPVPIDLLRGLTHADGNGRG